jgi:hypothetical protein
MKSILFSLIISLSALSALSQQENRPMAEFYGQLMTDIGYNFKQSNPDYFDVLRPTQLPSSKDEYGTDGNVFFSVRQSMLGLKSSLPTQYGDLKAKFAFDLFGVGPNVGQTTFHMLYAYLEWWKIGVGYTWSQFCDFDVYPNIVEYWGPSGMSLCKNVIVAYIPIQGKNRLSIALERPGASADQGIYRDRIELSDVKPKFALPDLSAEFRMTREWGYAELAGIVRKIAWEDQGNEPYDLSGSAIGWGFNLSSKLKVYKNDVFKGLFIVGQGIQNVMNDAPTDIGIENTFDDVNSPVKGVALPLISFSAYLDHYWSKKFSTSAGYSALYTGNSDGQADDAYRQGQYASINLLFYPLTNLMAGAEFQWIKRKNYNDGFESYTTRIQFSFRYSFSEVIYKKN